ncbi:MAG: DegQ family serine endoprotease [Planctomycetes bacterium]|nr:DegQ family serine endoprotease [Planctomycetota bacterium]
MSTSTPFQVRRRRAILLPLMAAIAFAGSATMMPLAAAEIAVVTSTTSFAPVVKQVAPSVVTVSTSRAVKRMQTNLPEGQRIPDEMRRFFDQDQRFNGRMPERQGIGSGVIVSKDGYILTNNHVIAGAQTITVTLPDRREPLVAKLIGADPKSDLAVLKIDDAGTLPAITLGDSDQIEVGDVVLAIGNPFGVGQTVTSGIISARGRGVGLADYEDYIQTDASINPGNSGGALVDTHGKLIGINTAILSPSGGNLGIGFAVPVNMARGIMDSLIANGKVTRGYLGVMIQPLTPELAKAFGVKNDRGVLVGDVVADSPAAKAGIKAGDVVVAFNGREVEDPRQLRLKSAQTVPGTKATLTVLRDGKSLNLDLTIGELKGDPRDDASPEAAQVPAKMKLGVRLGEIDNQAREHFEIPTSMNGVLVAEVIPGSRAADAGLQPGNVIVEVDRAVVNKPADAVAAIGKSEGDLVLRLWTKDGTRFVVVKERKGD